MTETNSCVEKDALIDYLYGEADAGARTRVDAHLRRCAHCADEVRGLKEVRGTLEAWVPPEADLGFPVVSEAHPEPAPVSLWGRLRPAWALAAAAVLVLAVATVIARPALEIEQGGMVLRIGWRETGADAPALTGLDPASQTDPALVGPAPRSGTQVQRSTPVAVGQRARDILPVPRGAEISQGSGAVVAADEWLVRVRQLIGESGQTDLSEMQRAFAEFDVAPELARQQLFEYLTRVAATAGAPVGTNEGPRP